MEIALDILVLLATIMLSGLGIVSMFAPHRMLDNFALEPKGRAGLSTIRSVIGGMFLASVAFLVAAQITGEALGYLAVAMVMGAVALGRLIGIVMDGFDRAVMPPLIVELVIMAVLTAAFCQRVA